MDIRTPANSASAQTLSSGSNGDNRHGRWHQRTLEPADPLVHLLIDPMPTHTGDTINPKAGLTEAQQMRLAERLSPEQRKKFALQALNFSKDNQDIRTLLKQQDRSLNSEIAKNHQLITRLVQDGTLSQERTQQLLRECQLNQLLLPVFDPKRDTGGAPVTDYINRLRSYMTPAEQDSVIEYMGKLLTPATTSVPLAGTLMRLLNDDRLRLECLQQAETLVIDNPETAPGYTLQSQDIEPLSDTLAALGAGADTLIMKLLIDHHMRDYTRISRSCHTGASTKSRLAEAFRILQNQRGTLSHHSLADHTLSVQELARIVDDMGYEVLADTLLERFHCSAPARKTIHPLPYGLLSLQELGKVILDIFLSLYGPYHAPTHKPAQEQWLEVASIIGVPPRLMKALLAKDYCPEEIAFFLAETLKDLTVDEQTWRTFNTRVQCSGGPTLERPDQPKTYRAYWNRPDESQLKAELHAYSANWRWLGFNLGFSGHDLKKIEQQYSTPDEALDQLLSLYMRRRTACWDQIIDALAAINLPVAAAELRKKYFPQ